MLNEAVFRSPKWLRKFMDFEISTGDDISDKAEKKEVEKKRLAAWDKAWRESDEDDFKEFFKERYKDYVRTTLNGWILTSDLSKIRNSFRGDMSIWVEFEKWKKEKENKKREQEKVKSELDKLFNDLVSDFSNNPYTDKYSTPKKFGRVCFHYKFENGDTFEMDENEIKYKNSIYTVGIFYRNKFVSLCNEIISKGRTRPGGSSSGSSSSGYNYYKQKSKHYKQKSNDPNRDRFDKVKDNIKLREEQLRKMSKTDPQREALENELDNLKRALKRMKDRYQFEHITNYLDFKGRV